MRERIEAMELNIENIQLDIAYWIRLVMGHDINEEEIAKIKENQPASGVQKEVEPQL